MGGFDSIVIGLGAMGSAAACELAGRGERVLGLDAHPRGHTLGSSHGQSRIIREAYFEAPEYVPLVQRAYDRWHELAAESGRALLRPTGGVNLGRPGGELIVGALDSARRHGLAYELLGPAELAARFPALRPAEDQVAVFEPRAAILDPEACVAAQLDLAARRGAELHHAEAARRWSADGEGVRVETERATYRAARLVITAGPWAGELLAELGLPLTVRRMLNVYFEPREPARFGPERLPVYIVEAPDGMYYGFPALPGQGLKFGRHDRGEDCTPATARRTVEPAEVEALEAVLERYLPGAAGRLLGTTTCLYTLTPDGHFVVDRHPAHPRVAFGCGFSGHGFKFANVIGEALADLVLTGRARSEIGFLSAARFAAPAGA